MSNIVHSLLYRSHLETLSNINEDFPLDRNVIIQFPESMRVLFVDRYEFSTWTVTARIVTELVNDTSKKYFIKCATEDAERVMMKGEY